jgi:N-methylhydantoinase A
VSYRLRLRVAVPKFQPLAELAPKIRRPLQAALKGTRAVHFKAARAETAQIYERDRLDIGAGVSGPAIVEQFDSTTVIPGRWTGRVDELRNLVLERG